MKPKYRIGQKVFHLVDNTVYEEEITLVALVDGKFRYHLDSIAFNADIGKAWDLIEEVTLFPTKDALLKSL